MFTCRMPMVGKNVGFEALMVGWMTHGLVVDDPPNDPQYGVEHLVKGLVGTGRSPLGDGLVFKAMVACLIHRTHIYGQCVSFLFKCQSFHVCLRIFGSLFV